MFRMPEFFSGHTSIEDDILVNIDYWFIVDIGRSIPVCAFLNISKFGVVQAQ